MDCPHCSTSINWSPSSSPLLYRTEAPIELEGSGVPVSWEAQAAWCPECEKAIIYLLFGQQQGFRHNEYIYLVDEDKEFKEFLVWPQTGERVVAPLVPAELREDFSEAARVLSISPKASAALSRRCLQHLLRTYGGVKRGDLSKEIEEYINKNTLSSDLAGQLDALRNIGNFAAHPQKSSITGEILPVEPHEAEWNLDVLEELFDHFFTKPEKVRLRREALNKKLAEAGKPLLP